MSYLDILLSVLLIYYIATGYKNGLINSLYSFLLMTVGITISYFIALYMSPIFCPSIIASYYLTFGLIFIGIFMLMRIVIKKIEINLKELLQKFELVWLDPLLGGVMGFLKVAIGVFIITSLVLAFNVNFMAKPIIKSKIATNLYGLVRHTTNINLIKTLREMSFKSSLKKGNELFNEYKPSLEQSNKYYHKYNPKDYKYKPQQYPQKYQ